jgi:hypothetical protein
LFLEFLLTLFIVVEVSLGIFTQGRRSYFASWINTADFCLALLCMLFLLLMLGGGLDGDDADGDGNSPSRRSSQWLSELDALLLGMRFLFQVARLSVLVWRSRQAALMQTQDDVDFNAVSIEALANDVRHGHGGPHDDGDGGGGLTGPYDEHETNDTRIYRSQHPSQHDLPSLMRMGRHLDDVHAQALDGGDGTPHQHDLHQDSSLHELELGGDLSPASPHSDEDRTRAGGNHLHGAGANRRPSPLTYPGVLLAAGAAQSSSRNPSASSSRPSSVLSPLDVGGSGGANGIGGGANNNNNSYSAPPLSILPSQHSPGRSLHPLLAHDSMDDDDSILA